MRRRSLNFCFSGFLALWLIIVGILGIFPASANNTNSSPELPWWDLNKASACGRMWCSQVFLLGGLGSGLTVAIAPPIEQDNAEAIENVQGRAKLIQKIYASIYETLLTKIDRISGKFRPDARIKEQLNLKDLLWQADQLGFHPDTPKIEVGIRNNQTVVYIPNQPDLGLSQQPIATVTEADALYYGKTISEVADVWRGIIQNSLSQALWGQALDRKYPWVRPAMLLGLLILFAIPIFFVWVCQRFLQVYDRKLRRKMVEISRSLAMDSSLWDEEDFSRSLPQELWRSWQASRQIPLFQRLRYWWRFFLSQFSSFARDQFGYLKQLHNVIQLLIAAVFWLQVWFFFIALATFSLVYPQSRLFVLFFTRQAFILPLIWMILALLDKICGLIIDYLLLQWAQDNWGLKGNSTRLRLQVSTYSPALKGALTFLLVMIGIYFTLQLYVRDATAIASAGGAAVVVAFLSRNVLEDMLNGALILFTDRYVMGDLIKVGDISGLVESMDLYTTRIRGAEGRLVSIPNGKISIVENLSKDWSRVELEVAIAEDTDIDTVCRIIDRTAASLREDSNWKDLILEPASILGVEAFSSQGIVIKVWLKTQPAQQWAVGREFRLRVKLALDEAGISLAVPRQIIFSPERSK
jgi:small conductance mechanosensitive channel